MPPPSGSRSTRAGSSHPSGARPEPAPALRTKARLDNQNVVAFDTETTGLHVGARLVEIAAIKYVGGREVGRLVSLVDPGELIPSAATAVHGITSAMVRGKPKAAQVLRTFQNFIQDAVLVAHYATFDLRIVNYELQRARLPLLKNAHICTRNLSRRHLPELYDHKLTTVARHLKLLTGEQEHRALGDALLVAAVYQELMGIGTAAITSSGTTVAAERPPRTSVWRPDQGGGRGG